MNRVNGKKKAQQHLKDEHDNGVQQQQWTNKFAFFYLTKKRVQRKKSPQPVDQDTAKEGQKAHKSAQ